MWWDKLPIHGLIRHRPQHPDAARLDSAIMGVIQRTLKIDSIACQESGLYGLGIWGIYYPKAANDAIDEYIRGHPNVWRKFTPGVLGRGRG